MGGCVSHQQKQQQQQQHRGKSEFDSVPERANCAKSSPTLSESAVAASAAGGIRRSAGSTPVSLVQHHQHQHQVSSTASAAAVVRPSSSSSSSRASSLKRLHHIVNNNNNNNNNSGSNGAVTPPHAVQVVAMFDYVARIEGEVSFSTGDAMYLIEQNDPDWWYVEHRKTRAYGYVPVALIAIGDSLESKSWFAGPLPRNEAERQLLRIGNRRGTFLVRQSETISESYSLSVLDAYSSTGRDVVKHYRIRMLDNGLGCYITSQRRFPSVQALVDNYTAQLDGLCCRLSMPCPRPVPTIADLSYQTRDHWEIPREQLKLVEQLGSGQFGEVWRGLFNGRLEVAVKMLKAGSMSRADFLKEARIMKRLRHPKLVQLFAVCTDGDPVYIVTELMSRGSLLTHLRESRPHDVELPTLLDILGQVACGMAYLESERFIHRDLAARNILVGDNNCVKVADFGLSRAIGDSEAGEYTARQGAKFPIKWTSPEAALHGRFSIKSDVWSFGVVVYEVVTRGQMPYPSMSNAEALDAIHSGYRMPRPSDCPQALHDLMLTCWEAQPDRRPTFGHLRHFFDDFFLASESSYRGPTAAAPENVQVDEVEEEEDDEAQLEAKARIV